MEPVALIALIAEAAPYVIAGVGAIAAAVQTKRKSSVEARLGHASDAADNARQALATMIAQIEVQHAIASTPERRAELKKLKERIRRAEQVIALEETLVSPMVKQVADIVRGFNAATLSSEDGQAVAERAAANAFERLRAMPPPRRRTSRLMGFAAPPVIAVLLLTGCAGSGILCPPRYTEEVFVDGGELDPDAVVLILPGNAPGEIGYYFLHEDAETGALTLTFPLVKEVE